MELSADVPVVALHHRKMNQQHKNNSSLPGIREKDKFMLKNNNPTLISDTIADILYSKIQTQYKKFGKPVIHITDFEVFQAALESRNPANIWFYNSELVAQSLNKIKGVTASYFCEDEDEHDGEITVVLTESIN